jgi:TonB family protein
MNTLYGKSLSLFRRSRRWSGLMVAFAIIATGLLFFSLSWMNKLPRKTPTSEEYSAIEIFPLEIPPPPALPVTRAMPIVTDMIAPQTKMETTEFTYKPTEFAPRMANWLPVLPLVQVPLTLRTIEIPATPHVPQPDIAKPTGPMQLFQVDQAPKKISGRLPSYPFWARAQGAEGVVILRFVVDRNGKVGKIEIDQVTGDPRFAQTAKKAVTEWTFSPALYNARPVAVWCRQRIQFNLD